MVGADHLRVVFYVNGTGFVMPVADLLAIRGPGEDQLTMTAVPAGSLKRGSMEFRQSDVAIYDLALLFELGESPEEVQQLLVFAGSQGPWAVLVDHVEGVIDVNGLTFHDLPGYLFRDDVSPYRQVAIYDNRLLVSADVLEIENAWCGSQ